MATPTDAPPAAESQAPSEEEKWQEEQAALAASQNLTAENAVPEKRPIASQQSVAVDSDLTKKLKESGAPGYDDEPMGKEAYDRADSDVQKKKAEKASVNEGIMVGNVVKVTNEGSPHFGRVVAVTRITRLSDDEDRTTKALGQPEQLYIHPVEIEGRAIGDDRDGEVLLLEVEEHGLVKVSESDWHARRMR